MLVHRDRIRRALAVLGCSTPLAVLAGCPGPTSSATPSLAGPTFDAARAWKHLEAQVQIGPRPAGTPEAERARAYLESQLSAAGLTPVREAFEQATPVGALSFCNVYADLPATGDASKAPLVLLVSHYDTKRMEFPFVGANDGGSSTAVLLELARVLKDDAPRSVSYRFLFVDGEEAVRAHWQDPDNRYGSKRHAEGLVKSGVSSRVKAAVLLDMVGDKELRIHRDEYSAPWLYEAFAAAARKNGLAKHVDGPRERIADDHLSFIEIGIPAVDLIDFEYGPGNSYWHSAQDTLEHCSQESLGIAGRIVLLGLPAIEAKLAPK